MHPLKPLMKKLVIIYAVAVATVILYFVLRLFFQEDTLLELRHFNTQSKTTDEVQEHKEEEPKAEQKFMLLPQK
jgi:hypothetical protein